jgi:hypothetical protein
VNRERIVPYSWCPLYLPQVVLTTSHQTAAVHKFGAAAGAHPILDDLIKSKVDCHNTIDMFAFQHCLPFIIIRPKVEQVNKNNLVLLIYFVKQFISGGGSNSGKTTLILHNYCP